MHISRRKFDRLVERAIASLPQQFAQWLDEVPVIVEDTPGPADRPRHDSRDEDDPILGVYQGSSLLGRLEDSGQLPPRIVLYRRALMEACDSLPQLAEEIRKTLVHELGHHAGMDEDQLAESGYGPLESEDNAIEWDVDEGGE